MANCIWWTPSPSQLFSSSSSSFAFYCRSRLLFSLLSLSLYLSFPTCKQVDRWEARRSHSPSADARRRRWDRAPPWSFLSFFLLSLLLLLLLLLLRLLLLFILLPLLVLFRPLLVFLFVWRRFAPFCAVRLRLASQFGSDQRRAVDADGDVPVRRTSHRRLAHSPQLRKRLARNRVRRKKKPEHHPLTRNVSAVGAEMAWSICLLAASGAAVARWSSSLERKGSLFPRN